MALFHTTVLDNQIKALPTVDTASGSIATFDTDMTENLVEVKCQIVAQQSGSGTPSPSNPRPITVYTSLNLSHSGADTSNPTVYNIPFGQTVAIGVLNVGTGKLRVTWVEVDLGSLSWVRKTDGAIPYFRHDFTDSSLTQLNRAFVCSNYPNVPFSDIYSNGQDKASSSYSGGIFIISDTAYSDATAFTTAMSGVQLIYELATPIEIQLDSITLQALLNENNIWCDTNGDTEVKYFLTVGKKIS